MSQAFLFDFYRTLIRSQSWIDLEVRQLPQAAFAHMAKLGAIPPLDPDSLSRIEAIFQAARQVADTTGLETSHVDDLMAMVEALSLQDCVSRQLAEETVAALHRDCIPTVELIEGAVDTLRRLQDMGFRLGIISNAAYAPFLTWILERFEIIEFFEQVVVSADVGTRKPWPEIFFLTLDRMGLSSSEAAYVGDDFRRDIVAAKRAGLRAIWYRPEDDPPSLEKNTTPDVIVTALVQVPAWGERWRHQA